MNEDSTGPSKTFVPNRTIKNQGNINILSALHICPGTKGNASYQRVQNQLQYMDMLTDQHVYNLKEKHAFMSDMKLGAKSTRL